MKEDTEKKFCSTRAGNCSCAENKEHKDIHKCNCGGAWYVENDKISWKKIPQSLY